jgi:hypothetical protein
MNLIEMLRLFLRPAVEGETETVETEKKEEAVTEEKTEDLDVDVDADIQEEKKDDKSPEAEQALSEIRAERARADRFERELSEIKGRQSQPPIDEITRQEEDRLRDAKTSDLEKWQIQANRELRRGRSEAQLALAQAQDISDKTSFSRIANTNPTLYKRYESRVEEELAKMRSRGYNASREAIMDNLIGKDMREGKFAKKKQAESDTNKKTVERGRLPGARSDVAGKNAMSEHEKRRQRLENQQI